MSNAPAISNNIVLSSIIFYFVSLMPAAKSDTDKKVPETNVDKLTLPENPGMKKPITAAPKSTLPKSNINFDNASVFPDDIIVA